MDKNHKYLTTEVTDEDLANAIADKYGVLYSQDSKRLLRCENKTDLTSITISDGVTTISRSAFYGCSVLTETVIPNSVTTISDSAFYFCESLKWIEVPDFVISIGDFSFMFCRNLEKVTLGSSLKYVGIFPFADCPALGCIRSRNSEPPIFSGDISFDAPCMLYVPIDSKAAYANSAGWDKFLCIKEGR